MALPEALFVLILWIYYLSVILYFGTTFTKTYAYLYRGKIIPEPFAVKLQTKELERVLSKYPLKKRLLLMVVYSECQAHLFIPAFNNC